MDYGTFHDERRINGVRDREVLFTSDTVHRSINTRKGKEKIGCKMDGKRNRNDRYKCITIVLEYYFAESLLLP